jgi:hypothetical protein
VLVVEEIEGRQNIVLKDIGAAHWEGTIKGRKMPMS